MHDKLLQKKMFEAKIVAKETQKTNYESKFNKIDNFFLEEEEQRQFYDLSNDSLFMSTTSTRKRI